MRRERRGEGLEEEEEEGPADRSSRTTTAQYCDTRSAPICWSMLSRCEVVGLSAGVERA